MTETITARPVDPFDPAALRLDQNFADAVGVKKLLNRVPVRKPGRQDFVRVHPALDRRLTTMILELKEDREVYLVMPNMREELLGEQVPVTLFQTINRQGIVSLWPCRLPGPDGKTNPWHQSALEAAEHAMRSWVRVAANMALGAYDIYEAVGDLPDPEWPELSLAELLKIAFRDACIDSPEHPVVRRLRGDRLIVAPACQIRSRSLAGAGSRTVGEGAMPLPELGRRIQEARNVADTRMKSAVDAAIEAGRLLAEARSRVPYGEWRTWLERNTGLSERTAQRYLNYAKHAEQLQAAEGLSIRAADRVIAGAPRPKSATRGGFGARPSAPVKITDAAARHRSGLGLAPSMLPPELVAQRIGRDLAHAGHEGLDLTSTLTTDSAAALVTMLRPFSFEMVCQAVGQLADALGLALIIEKREVMGLASLAADSSSTVEVDLLDSSRADPDPERGAA